jgi:hypothetical protein
MITLYSDSLVEYINPFCSQTAEFWYVKAGGTDS